MKTMKTFFSKASLILLTFLIMPFISDAQRKKRNAALIPQYPVELYSSMEYRLVGPFRGGRSAAVTGVPGEPNLFYFGATGGGVWKTTNGGRSWMLVAVKRHYVVMFQAVMAFGRQKMAAKHGRRLV